MVGEAPNQRDRRTDILVEKTGTAAGEGAVHVAADGRRVGGEEGMEGEEGGMAAVAGGGGIRVAGGAGGGGDREEDTKEMDDGCSAPWCSQSSVCVLSAHTSS